MQTPVLPQAADSRQYETPADVARACGLSEYDLLTKYRPYDWSTPRDFVWRGRNILVTRSALPRLADCLVDCGQTDAAARLRRWAAQLTAPAVEPQLQPASVQRELFGADPGELTPELEAVNQRMVARTHPSDPESARFAWED